MKILLTGANGYIGMRLLPVLVEGGHQVTCVVRDQRRFAPGKDLLNKIEVLEYDFLHPDKALQIFNGKTYDVSYYLIHSLGDTSSTLKEYELRAAGCFVLVCKLTTVRQIIYLSGIANESLLSPHLSARQSVKTVIQQSGIPFTIFEAGIIIGSGSLSFEIIRDLTEKLPLMVVPYWLNSLCQPIAVRNVIYYLENCLLKEPCFNRHFEIGGPDVLSYKKMILQYAEVRGYKRYILSVPKIIPFLSVSTYWLYLMTSANFTIAKQLVYSMKNDMICKDHSIHDIIPQPMIPYKEAIQRAFVNIDQNMVLSSWTDSASSSLVYLDIKEHIQVPVHGCFKDKRWTEIDPNDALEVKDRFMKIGGERGWYYATWLWRIRGFIDKLQGGVGMSRGRRQDISLQAGDTLDFWRVLLADHIHPRLLLFAEMKAPGEAWLEFSIVSNQNKSILTQTATFRPRGLAGRLYWYSMLPFHFFIFRNMMRNIAHGK